MVINGSKLPFRTIMKRFLFLVAAVIVSGLFNVSCETTGDGRADGISAPTGSNREGIYQMQDRALRQLAY